MKLIFLFFTFFITNKIEALEWKEEMENYNNYIIESEIKYKFYKLDLVESVYETFNPIYFKDYDLKDYIYSDYSNWDIEKPPMVPNRMIEMKTEKHSYDIDKCNYLTIQNKEEDILFDDIVIKKMNSSYRIPFEIEITNRNEIINSIPEEGINMTKDTIISIKLNEIYDVKDLDIYFYYKYYKLSLRKIKFSFTNDKIYHTKTTVYTNQFPCDNEICYFRITDHFAYVKVSDFLVDKYRYKDVLYKRNVYNKIYEENYYTELEGYTKDIETAKVFYKTGYSCPKETILENETLETTDNSLIALNDKIETKVVYNYYLIYGCLFLIIGTILLALLFIMKKLIKKCRTK